MYASNYVESAPSLINKDRGKQLVRKWAKLLDFNSKDCPVIENSHTRLATAMLLENQENWLKQQGHMPRLLNENMLAGGVGNTFTAYGNNSTNIGGTGNALRPSDGYDGTTPPHPQDTYAPGDARLPKVLIPMIRRTFPELITNEIVGVQPMAGPVGLAFALRYRYEADPLACANDSNCSINAYTNPEGWRAPSDGREAGYQYLNTAFTGVTAAGLTGLGAGSDFEFDAADMGVAQLLSYFEQSANIPQMTLEVEKTAVEAGTRRLATKWSIELEQDIMNMNGIDIDAELTNAMSYEIQAEIDREMVMRMIQVALNAGAPSGYSFWNPIQSDGRWFGERGVALYAKIVTEANRMAIRNRRGPANFIIATPRVCTILQLLPEFKAFNINGQVQQFPNGVARVGSLAGQFNIYRDTRTEAQYLAGGRQVEYCLLGYKGSEFWDTGIVYCPYIPVMVQRAIGPNDWTPRVGMLTRYGIIDHLFGSQNFYHLVIVKDLDTGFAQYPATGTNTHYLGGYS